MRVDNKGGFTPRGRRLGRGLVAVAALAVLLSAASAPAAVLQFQVVPELSSLGFHQYFGQTVSEPTDEIPYYHFGAGQTFLYLGNIHPDWRFGDHGPEPDPSNVASAIGNFAVDVNPGVSLKIQPGGYISYLPAYQYYPFRDVDDSIASPPGGVGVGGVSGKLAQFGLSVVGGIGVGPDQKLVFHDGGEIGLANIYDFAQTFGSLSTQTPDGGAAMPHAGGDSYTAFDLALFGLSGIEDIWSSAITDDNGLSGFPTPIGAASPGTATTMAAVTWDGTYLTIPVNNRFAFYDSGSSTLFDITTFGQIVAVVVPEPSSIAMLACGAIGLVGYVVRRKRKG